MIRLLFLLLPLYSLGQSTSDLDAKNGYKDIRMDMNADSLIKAIRARPFGLGKNKEEVEIYVLPSKTYGKMGDYTVTPYLGKYGKENKLVYIALYFTPSTESAFKDLVSFFSNMYGTPTTYDKIYQRAIWKGELITLDLNYNSYAKSVSCFISSNEVAETLEAAKKEKLKTQAKDF